ncbi:hypothetical protein JCM5296_006619, partial [Sporobolomyces johnsonii]
MHIFLALSLFALTALADRSLIITNDCAYTVYPAVLNTLVGGGYTGPRGWEAAAGSSNTVSIPDTWNGRVWARRGCTFDSTGAGSCVAGDCGGGLECADATTGWANWLEMNLNSWAGMDFWDISA